MSKPKPEDHGVLAVVAEADGRLHDAKRHFADAARACIHQDQRAQYVKRVKRCEAKILLRGPAEPRG